MNDNDADKWQKNRDKIDDETQIYYAEELALLDVLNGLWNEQSEQAATNYFGCYERAVSYTHLDVYKRQEYGERAPHGK